MKRTWMLGSVCVVGFLWLIAFSASATRPMGNSAIDGSVSVTLHARRKYGIATASQMACLRETVGRWSGTAF